MSKYKIVGLINIYFGILLLLASAVFLMTVFPQLRMLYTDLNAGQPNLAVGYAVVVLASSVAVANIYLGAKSQMMSKDKDKEKYFKNGQILAIATIVLLIVLAVIMTSSTLSPIYGLTNNL
jgi:uncharacterized membrane protein YidH (DUF202 family)